MNNCNLNDPNQVRLVLKVDRPHYTTGGVISGRVYLSLPRDAALDKSTKLRLTLDGMERVTSIDTWNRHEHDKCHHKDNTRSKNDQAMRQLILVDCIPAVALPTTPLSESDETTTASSSCFEYPFAYTLPAHMDLPSSMFCYSENGVAEIRYTLTASLSNNTQASSCVVIYVAASQQDDTEETTTSTAPTKNTMTNPACLVHPQVFCVGRSFCCGLFSRGTLRLGWETDQSIYHTGDVVQCHVQIDHSVAVMCQSVQVQLMETTSWQTHGQRRQTFACLAQQTLPATAWKRRDRDDQEPTVVHLYAVTIPLAIPQHARDSYASSMLSVKHNLVVTVETNEANKCGVAVSPESVGPIQIVRGACQHQVSTSSRKSSQDQENTSATTNDDDDYEQDIPETVKDDDSMIQQATLDTTDIPVVQAEPLQEVASGWRPVLTCCNTPADDDVCPESRENLTFMLTAAAPDDGWKCPEPCRKLQLQQMVSRASHPEQALEQVIQDATWAVTIQNISPCEFAAILLEAATGGGRMAAAKCAVLLAVVMGPQFTTLHILAAVRHLHLYGNAGMEVLRQTVPLVPNLNEESIAWLEEQLDPSERVHLRAALA